jgi:hypothetical protein
MPPGLQVNSILFSKCDDTVCCMYQQRTAQLQAICLWLGLTPH